MATKKTTKKAATKTVTSKETAPQETVKKDATQASEAKVYNRYHNLMRVFTKEENGKDFEELAHDLVQQPRRQGWYVVVR